MNTTPPNRQDLIHVVSVLVDNEFGVLARIAQLFAARGFNIESLTVGPTHDETVSRMTIVVKGSTPQVDQVRKQLAKLVEVIAVQDLSEGAGFVEREVMLIKVRCKDNNRTELMTAANLFKAEAVDATPSSITLQLVAESARLDDFISFVQPFGIMELCRSGAVALNRGFGGLQSSFIEKANALTGGNKLAG
jgi:acetolactate synthase-1/3 small subunit